MNTWHRWMAESFTRPYRQIFTGQKQNNARVPVALEAQAHVVSADTYVEAQHPFVFPRTLLPQLARSPALATAAELVAATISHSHSCRWSRQPHHRISTSPPRLAHCRFSLALRRELMGGGGGAPPQQVERGRDGYL
jgi:hypothetical protein